MAESATFTEPDGPSHLVYVDEMGRPDECTEDCPGCHWEGNTDCEALPYGCDTCDPDGKAQAGCGACGHLLVDHDAADGCGACAMAMRPFRHDYRSA